MMSAHDDSRHDSHDSHDSYDSDNSNNTNTNTNINTNTIQDDLEPDIGNPFIIKKRKLLPVPTVRSKCIFKKPMQLEFLYAFIETMCGPPIESTKIMHILKGGVTKTNQVSAVATGYEFASAFYMIDIFAFKRGLYMNVIRPFMDTVARQYYRPAHAFYAERSMTGPSAFTQFIQVIRHISKHINLKVVSTVKYEQSSSSKVYYVECTVNKPHT